jgi:hypothetical protein
VSKPSSKTGYRVGRQDLERLVAHWDHSSGAAFHEDLALDLLEARARLEVVEAARMRAALAFWLDHPHAAHAMGDQPNRDWAAARAMSIDASVDDAARPMFAEIERLRAACAASVPVCGEPASDAEINCTPLAEVKALRRLELFVRSSGFERAADGECSQDLYVEGACHCRYAPSGKKCASCQLLDLLARLDAARVKP